MSKFHSATECLHEMPGKEKCNLWKQAGTLRWALRDRMSIWADTRLAGHGIRESPTARRWSSQAKIQHQEVSIQYLEVEMGVKGVPQRKKEHVNRVSSQQPVITDLHRQSDGKEKTMRRSRTSTSRSHQRERGREVMDTIVKLRQISPVWEGLKGLDR